VNFYSRVQMYLFKAKQAAVAEYEKALETYGVTREQVRAFLDANPRYASPLHKAPHVYSGNCADLVAEIAPLITKSRTERLRDRLASFGARSKQLAQTSPHMIVSLVETTVKSAPEVAARLKEDWILLGETRRAAKAKAAVETSAAAAE
jgi:hypothetical protein